MLDKVVAIDQSPIGRTPRSNPATYTGAVRLHPRAVRSVQKPGCAATSPGRFSFNVKGGRCEACQGDGTSQIEMHFLPDVYVPCEVCHGKRYNRETLEIRYKGKNIAEVLDMSVEEAAGASSRTTPRSPGCCRRCTTWAWATSSWVSPPPRSPAARPSGSSWPASWPVAHRAIRSTSWTSRPPGCTSPTSRSCSRCCNAWWMPGNTVLVIEHNLDVIKSADWLIDLGPEGGAGGGRVVAVGTPEEVAAHPDSHTGEFLRRVLPGFEEYRGDRRAPGARARGGGVRVQPVETA